MSVVFLLHPPDMVSEVSQQESNGNLIKVEEPRNKYKSWKGTNCWSNKTVTSSAIPVPHPIDMKGDLANNWEFFKEPWTNYETATELDTKNEKIRVATLLAIIEEEALQIYRHLPIT